MFREGGRKDARMSLSLLLVSLRDSRLGSTSVAGKSALGLLLLFNGPLWHWELNEKPPVAAAAALAKTADATLPLALWGHGERPSLSWQSQRQLVPLARLGIPAGPVQLLSPAGAPIPEVANRHCDQQASSEDGWSLWICAPRP